MHVVLKFAIPVSYIHTQSVSTKFTKKKYN